MGVFGFPYAPLLFIEAAGQVKISFVGKSNVAHMDIALINFFAISLANVFRALIEAMLKNYRGWLLYG